MSTIYVYDMRGKGEKNSENYDEVLFVSTLQGIVNKKGAIFYIYHAAAPHVPPITPEKARNMDEDIINALREPGQWLEEYTVTNLNAIDDVISQFGSYFSGIVAWDPEVDATVNVATTIAGVEDTPIVMYGGKMYDTLTSAPYNKSVSRNLYGMFTGADSKTDAYYWARTNFLVASGTCDGKVLAYIEDGYARSPMGRSNMNTTSRDYLVKNKAFAFDLSPWPDEIPNDAPESTLGKDYDCLNSILASAQARWGQYWTMDIVGFLPWADKYTLYNNKGTRSQTDSEKKMTELFSTYGGGIINTEASGPSNASFHCWAPYPVRLSAQEAPSRVTLDEKTYLCFMNGDYDGAAMETDFTSVWNDPGRGQIPVGWALIPSIIKDYPSMYTYLRNTATKNDYFWAGASGSTYANPGFVDSDVWKAANEYYFDRAGYSMTAFIANSNAGTVTNEIESMYSDFSGDGISVYISNAQTPDYDVRNGNLVVAKMDSGMSRTDITQAVARINYLRSQKGGANPNFILIRTAFAMPVFLEQVYKKLLNDYPQYNYELVDPYTMFSLIRQDTLGQQEYDAVVANIQWPERMVAGEKYDVKVALRNAGTNTWTRADLYRLAAGANSINDFIWSDWQDGGSSTGEKNQRVYLSTTDTIAPQQTKTFSFKITAPATAGNYNFNFRMVRDGYVYFGTDYTKSISVVVPTAMEARITAISVPNELAAGQTDSVSVTVKNVGTSTWTRTDNYKLAALKQMIPDLKAMPNNFIWSGFPDGGSSTNIDNQRVYLSNSDSIAPGQSKTFTFDITAPYGTGTFVFSAKMVRDGYAYFGDDAVAEVTVVPSGRSTNDAREIVVLVPQYVNVNEKVNVSVSVMNTGTSTWTKAQGFSLAADSNNEFIFIDMHHGGESTSVTNQKVYLSDLESIKPFGSAATFNFSITAPGTTGVKELNIIMYKNGTGTFGESISAPINVTNATLNSDVIFDGIPDQIAAGAEVAGSLTIMNTGSEAWTRTALHRLGSGASSGNQIEFIFRNNVVTGESTGSSTGPLNQRVYLPSQVTVFQNQTRGFGITMKAPDTPGQYTFSVQMVSSTAWFGEIFTKTIDVVSGYVRYINCGGTSLTDEKGIVWSADQAYTGGSWGYTGTTTTASTANSISPNFNYDIYGTTQYKTCRKGSSFGYRFDSVPNGKYKVTLFFADIISTASAQNLTSFSAEGNTKMTAFDVYKHESGNYKGTYTQSFTVSVTDGVLNLDFSALAGNAFVNAMIVQRVG